MEDGNGGGDTMSSVFLCRVHGDVNGGTTKERKEREANERGF